MICGKWLGTFYEHFVRIFLFAVVVVMISGTGATLNEYYGWNYYVGSLLMAVLIFAAFAFGFNKLIDVIGCIGPVIIVFSIVVAAATIVSGGVLFCVRMYPPLQICAPHRHGGSAVFFTRPTTFSVRSPS